MQEGTLLLQSGHFNTNFPLYLMSKIFQIKRRIKDIEVYVNKLHSKNAL